MWSVRIAMPRRSEFSQDIADTICDRLANGESLRAICRDDEMPVQSTVFKWLDQQPAFAKQYARAREAQADTLADEILEIADDTSRDTIVTEKNGEQPNSEWITRSRLRVDARKWLASKMAPKKYGEKLDLDATVNGKLETIKRVIVDPAK